MGGHLFIYKTYYKYLCLSNGYLWSPSITFTIDVWVLYGGVQNFLEENPRPNPFKINWPGDGWYRKFLDQHPNLTERKPEVTAASANVSESDIIIILYLTKKYNTTLHSDNTVK